MGPNEFRVEFQSKPDSTVELNLTIEPAGADINWQWWSDGTPWPKNNVFAGPLGVVAPELAQGLRADESDYLIAPQQAFVSAVHEFGIFIARDMRAEPAMNVSESAQVEAQQAMQAWGYVRKPEIIKKKQQETAQ
jgi:hypothetical protein